jgi:hypothetical protein
LEAKFHRRAVAALRPAAGTLHQNSTNGWSAWRFIWKFQKNFGGKTLHPKAVVCVAPELARWPEEETLVG